MDKGEETLESRINSLIECTYKMEYLFVGSHWKAAISLTSLRLFAHLLSFLHMSNSNSYSSSNNSSLHHSSQFKLLSQRCNHLFSLLDRHFINEESGDNVKTDIVSLLDFTTSIISFYSSNEASANGEFTKINLPGIANLVRLQSVLSLK